MTPLVATAPRELRTAIPNSVFYAVIAWLLAAQSVLAVETRTVLVLYSNNRLVPGNVDVDRGLRAALTNTSERAVVTYSEFLDEPDFGGPEYEANVARYLREKYSTRRPDAIVGVSNEAFAFLLRHRGDLFPGIPLVHAAVATTYLQSIPVLPADVVGVPRDYDPVGTIQQALRWHPSARRLVLVTGASERDNVWETRLHKEIPANRRERDAGIYRGSANGVRAAATGRARCGYRRVHARLFSGRRRRAIRPRATLPCSMANASAAPVYGPFDTFIGTGVVGGRMPSFEEMGRQAAAIVTALFDGTAPASLHLPLVTPMALRVDWRQVRRWGIDENKIPADTVVSFRTPTFWEANRNVLMIIAAVILLQALLIATLLIERRRRRVAEQAVQKQRSELAHASRLAMAGELTASIAHEINQPLGAILASADAAELLLESGADRRDDLRRIVARIRRDDLRASDVIGRLRTLLAKHEPERKRFEVNEAVTDVVVLLQGEARQRRVILESRPSSIPLHAVGDPIQIQQVLINLVLNAMDAVADLPEDRQLIVVSADQVANGIQITVRDRGRGIAPEHLPKLFDSFFSTKQRGMGLGLSIARTIVEAHGGRIWAENGPGDGAVFRVELPASNGANIPGSA